MYSQISIHNNCPLLSIADWSRYRVKQRRPLHDFAYFSIPFKYFKFNLGTISQEAFATTQPHPSILMIECPVQEVTLHRCHQQAKSSARPFRSTSSLIGSSDAHTEFIPTDTAFNLRKIKESSMKSILCVVLYKYSSMRTMLMNNHISRTIIYGVFFVCDTLL